MDPKHLDMSRLQAGAPLLNSHDSSNVDSVIGVVERAWLDGDKGKALVRFSADPIADKIYQKVKERVLRNVSVGYQVRKYEDVTQKGESTPTYRATNWQPHEISIVPIGFDPHAQVRSQEVLNEVEIEKTSTEADSIESSTNIEPQAQINEKERNMTEAEKLALELAAKKQAALEEKQRQSEIRLAVRTAKLEETYADELCSQEISADQARKQIFEKLAASQPAPVNTAVSISVGLDESTKKRAGFEDAMLHRMDSKNFGVTEQSKTFYGKSLLRQVEEFIPRNTMESDFGYATRVMSSSDLPLALANVAEKSLQKQYDLAPRTFEKWTRPDTLRNYKPHSQVKSGDFADLKARPEGAEFEQGSTGEDRELVQLADYGIIHAFTSQMLINDDLGVLTRLASSGGIAASRLENKLAYLALTTNKTMNDGIALYHASHGNLGTAGAIAQASVAEAYKLMRKQTSTNSKDPLNLTPKYFVCGPDKEAEAKQFFSSVNATQTSNINIYQNSMEVIVDAQITGNQFYFLCDPNLVDTVVVYRREGQSSPMISSRVKFSTNSLELKVDHAVAAAPMDWRGIIKNAGN